MAAKGRIKDQWREQRLFEQRAIFAGVVILLMTGALLARLAWLQVLRNDYYSELAQGNRVRVEGGTQAENAAHHAPRVVTLPPASELPRSLMMRASLRSSRPLRSQGAIPRTPAEPYCQRALAY